MAAGNFVAILFMAIAVWSVFTIFGEPWEGAEARLVVPANPEIYRDREAFSRLPDTMRVGAIDARPAR